MTDNLIVLARIGSAHGLKGEVRVKTFTVEPGTLASYGSLQDKTGRAFKIAGHRPSKDGLVVKFKGVNDRNAAEALNGTELLVDRSSLPDADEPDEYYHADLIGLAATFEDGGEAGMVIAVHDFGAGDILEIQPVKGASILVPFTQDAVPSVDLASGRLVLARLSEIEVRPEDVDEVEPGQS